MITPSMLPILHLRRQAATYGWRRAAARSEGFRSWRWINPDPIDGGVAIYSAATSDADGEEYLPDIFTVETGNSRMLSLDRFDVQRLPTTLRAHLGWVVEEATV